MRSMDPGPPDHFLRKDNGGFVQKMQVPGDFCAAYFPG